MVRIKKYDELINEELSWSNKILYGLFVISMMINMYGRFSKKGMTSLLKDIKDPSCRPSGDYYKAIEEIRKESIQEIESSPNIEESKKKEIVDSLRKIPFFIVDTKDYKGYDNSNAVYVCLKPVRTTTVAGFIRIDDRDSDSPTNFILVDRERFKEKQVVRTISHEIYHYIDRLLGKGYTDWSQINEITNIVNVDISDQDLKKRIVYLSGGENNLVDIIYDGIQENKEYLTRPSELFVRYHNLKKYLVEEGQMSSVHDKITENHLNYIISKGYVNLVKDDYDFAFILPFLNVNIDGMNKIISMNKNKNIENRS